MSRGWSAPDIDRIREHVDRIVAHDLFDQSERQSRFLSFIVDEELAGRGELVNQYAIAIDVFDRDASFDSQLDSIVRVEARRLRSKLAEYYAGAGRHDSIKLAVPKGGYRVRVDVSNLGDSDTELASTAGLTPTAAPFPRAASIPVVAVLPFDNFSNDPEQDYFCDGISEDIITDLSKLAGLRVISRHSTFVYRGRARNVRELGEELGAQFVLEGSVRKSNGRLRISAQLIEASSDRHLWAERYDRNLSDVFAIQDDVSQQIVAALRVQLTSLERGRLGHSGTRDHEAHDLFLRAQEQFYHYTAEGIEGAEGLLSMSIERDPGYAEAFAWRARVLVMKLISGISESRENTMEPAVESARRAVELDPQLAIAHAMVGWTAMFNGNGREAVSAAALAVELAPGAARVLSWYSLTLTSTGRGAEALEAIERALRLDPHYTATDLMALGLAHYALGQRAEAAAQFDRGIRRSPAFVFNHILKVCMLSLLGRRDQALAAAATLREFPRHARVASQLLYFWNQPELRAGIRNGLADVGIDTGPHLST